MNKIIVNREFNFFLLANDLNPNPSSIKFTDSFKLAVMIFFLSNQSQINTFQSYQKTRLLVNSGSQNYTILPVKVFTT